MVPRHEAVAKPERIPGHVELVVPLRLADFACRFGLVLQARSYEAPHLLRQRGLLPQERQRSVNLGHKAGGGPEILDDVEMLLSVTVLALPKYWRS